jgi:hypothetical protein
MHPTQLTLCSLKVPTSKVADADHFSCYLNEPAGQVAIVTVRHAVTQVVAAWSNPSIDPRQAIDSIMTVFCHPALLNHNSAVQMEMYAVVERWVNAMSPTDRNVMLEGLSKAGVRAGRHHDAKRNDGLGGHGTSGDHSHAGPGMGQGYITQASQNIPGYGMYQQAQGMWGQGSGYVQQTQQMFQSQGGGLSGFVQNLTRRDVDDDGVDYAPPPGPPPEDELAEWRDGPTWHGEQYGRQEPSSGPSSGQYRLPYHPPPPEPPYGGQPPYGYEGRGY